jgi:hypothetical protein
MRRPGVQVITGVRSAVQQFVGAVPVFGTGCGAVETGCCVVGAGRDAPQADCAGVGAAVLSRLCVVQADCGAACGMLGTAGSSPQVSPGACLNVGALIAAAVGA